MRKNILALNSTRARAFFLTSEIYLNLDLPPYYKFEQVLTKLSKKLGTNSLDIQELNSAKSFDNVNHIIFGNKDGNYAWRKYELINPLLYVSLVNTLCIENSWKLIQDRFNELNCEDSIRCVSIPVLGDSDQKQKASQINEWIDSVEKESIRLALDFEYLYQTDIVGCYSSIYTHSIAWAIHGKPISKENRKFSELLGNQIDHHIQAMCYGQTNGIPQGSVLMDFIAEMVLSYADKEIFERIKSIKKGDYSIIRYRDDYRIFVRNPKDGDYIMKEVSHVLAQLGMSLNTTKTTKSDKIILDSIKKDKLAMLKFPMSKKLNKTMLRNELLVTYEIGTIYPNSGSITKRLVHINDIVENKILQKNPNEIVSILINIAFENPKSFPLVAALISKTINLLSKKKKIELFNKLQRKIDLLPNSGIMEIWLQRIAIKHEIYNYYAELLCKNTNGENVEIFNTDWIGSKETRKILNNAKYIDYKVIKTLDTIISRKEIELFVQRLY